MRYTIIHIYCSSKSDALDKISVLLGGARECGRKTNHRELPIFILDVPSVFFFFFPFHTHSPRVSKCIEEPELLLSFGRY